MENKELKELTELREYVKNQMRAQISLCEQTLQVVSRHKPFTKEQEVTVIAMQTHIADCKETLSLWEGTDDLLDKPVNIN